MGEGGRVGELGIPSLKMDNNFMEPASKELCVSFSPLKVHRF